MQLEGVTLEHVQKTIAMLKAKLATIIIQPASGDEGRYAKLVSDIEALRRVAREFPGDVVASVAVTPDEWKAFRENFAKEVENA